VKVVRMRELDMRPSVDHPAPRDKPCSPRSALRTPATLANRTNKNGPLVAEGAIDLAAFYSPTGSPLQYHRRWKA
jgi:hypothetical protein